MPCYLIYNTELLREAKKRFKKYGSCHTFNVMKSLEGKRRVVGFMCGGDSFGGPCICGSAPEYLCDFPVDEGKTCDRPLCNNCATEISINIHYCFGHLKLWIDFVKSGGVDKVLKNVVPFGDR